MIRPMNAVRIVVIGLCFGTLAVSVSGCRPAYGGRQAIRGTVKLKGEPVDDGTIEFFPISGDGATKSGAQIIKGAYSIPREFGLLPGKYRVSITAGDGRTRANASPEEPPGPTG